jgi:hypothetical protein
MSFNARTPTIVFLGLLSFSLLSACGKVPSFVSNANVKFREDANQQQFVDVTSLLNTGLAAMPAMDIPIYDKTHTNIAAQVSMRPAINNQTELTLSINVSKIGTLPTCSGDPSLLPNGSRIPLATGSNQVICVPINATTGRLYIAPNFQTNELVVGAALTISQLQSIGQNMGSVNVFLPFNINSISGVYGFFTGQSAGQSGLGLFVDASNAIKAALGAIGGGQTLGAASASSAGTVTALSLPSSTPTARLSSAPSTKTINLLSTKIENTSAKQQKLLQALWNLQNKGK